jgi:hypothetical protein
MLCLLALCAATTTCRGIFEPGFPMSAVRIPPPPQYRVWWEVVEKCSGHTRSFDGVSWYRVPIGEGITLDGETAAGAWFASGNRIAIGDGWKQSGSLVRHEMLHAILQTGSHPAEYFRESCRDEVLCGENCRHELPLPNAIPLAVEQLTIDALFFPASPSLARDDGKAVVVVRVRNPYGVNAFATAQRFSQATCPVGFTLTSASDPTRTDGDCRSLEYHPADARVYFRPYESRRLVFELELRDNAIRGSFRPEAHIVSAILLDRPRGSYEVRIAP